MATPVHQRLHHLSLRTVDRDSGTFGVQTYEYGDVEIASEVGWDNYKRVADGIMQILTIRDLHMDTPLIHGLML